MIDYDSFGIGGMMFHGYHMMFKNTTPRRDRDRSIGIPCDNDDLACFLRTAAVNASVEFQLILQLSLLWGIIAQIFRSNMGCCKSNLEFY